MKRNIIYILVLALSLVFASSCVHDLNVRPIDPNLDLPEDVLNSEDAYEQVLAKCYAALAVSSSNGENGAPDIDGIDGGFGQYMRALFNLQTITTDEASVVWNDQTIHDLNHIAWTTSDVFVTAMFSRLYYQISLCNEFIRRAQASGFESERMTTMIAEARALRALSYYHAIDMFGNVPFATEKDVVGAVGPEQIKRPDLYDWIVEEIAGENGFRKDLKPASQTEYGRCSQEFATMLLAKMYLNSEVYTEGRTKAWSECIAECQSLVKSYPSLHSDYEHLFMGDNHLRTNEIIFAVQSDAVNTRSFGNTNFIIKASIVSGNSQWQSAMGINDGWGGLVVTPELVGLFSDDDDRNLFTDGSEFGEKPHSLEIEDEYDFASGWCAMKFKNTRSDGSAPTDMGWPDTDFPVFRAADAYLMLAEAEIRNGGIQADGLNAYNAVRERAGLAPVTTVSLNDILDERGRELYWENHRRSDLIRFGKYTTKDYLWSWKGGVKGGADVNSRFNLFPIPVNEINANSKLTQNPGY